MEQLITDTLVHQSGAQQKNHINVGSSKMIFTMHMLQNTSDNKGVIKLYHGTVGLRLRECYQTVTDIRTFNWLNDAPDLHYDAFATSASSD